MVKYDQDQYYERIECEASDLRNLCDTLQAERDEARAERDEAREKVESLQDKIASLQAEVDNQ